MKLPGIILAAGSSTRMGRPKALLPLGDSTFLAQLVKTFSACCDPVVIVLGGHAQAIQAAVTPPAVATLNRDHQFGMLSSLQTGLAQVPADAPGIVFTLVDHPRLQVATLEALLEQFRQTGADVVIPRHEGRRGHPVVITRRVIGELLALPKSGSPKDVIRRHRPTTLFVDRDDPAIVEDIDTPEDYRAILPDADT